MKPAINKIIPAFDANIGTSIEFGWQGRQARGSVLRFYNENDGSLAYEHRVQTLRLVHELPPSSQLRNGYRYNVTLCVLDIDGKESDPSDKSLACCYSSPAFNASGLLDGDVVRESYVDARIRYSQPQGERLNDWQMSVYDSGGMLIQASEVLHDEGSIAHLTGFTNGEYLLRCSGQTVHGMQLTAPEVRFTILYDDLPHNCILTTENVREKGYVRISPNIIIFGWESDGEAFRADGVDLRGGYVKYNKWVRIDGDFAMKIRMRDPVPYQEVIRLEDGEGGYISVRYMEYETQGYFVAPNNAHVPLTNLVTQSGTPIVTQSGLNIVTWSATGQPATGTILDPAYTEAYFLLEAGNATQKMILHTRFFDKPDGTDWIDIVIKRIGNLCDMSARIKGVIY